jgi:hypothetical protein
VNRRNNASELTSFNAPLIAGTFKGLAADDVYGTRSDNDDRHQRDHAFQHHQQFGA